MIRNCMNKTTHVEIKKLHGHNNIFSVSAFSEQGNYKAPYKVFVDILNSEEIGQLMGGN